MEDRQIKVNVKAIGFGSYRHIIHHTSLPIFIYENSIQVSYIYWFVFVSETSPPGAISYAQEIFCVLVQLTSKRFLLRIKDNYRQSQV